MEGDFRYVPPTDEEAEEETEEETEEESDEGSDTDSDLSRTSDDSTSRYPVKQLFSTPSLRAQLV